MQHKNEHIRSGSCGFSGIVVSVVKIFIVLVITLTFVLYIATPPDTRSFFNASTQSDTIVRTVNPV